MTAVKGEDDRDVIPRWRSFGTTVRMGELDSISEPVSRQWVPDLTESIIAFDEDPGNYTAGDPSCRLRHLFSK